MNALALIAVVAVAWGCGAAPLERSCREGDGQACLRHGRTYESRHRPGEFASQSLALRYYEKGCEVGLSDACFAAATLHRSGTFKDPQAAFALEERICDLGDSRGCLAVVKTTSERKSYDESLAAARQTDEERAKRLLEVACHKGLESACTLLNGR
jgi:TPR repeat protein